MVNRYKYTEDIIKEYQNAWWSNEFKVGNISMLVTTLVAIGLLTQAIQKKMQIFSLACYLLCQ